MANDLKTDLRTDERSSISPGLRHDAPLARAQAFPWMIVIVLLAASAWLAWRAFFYEEEGDPVGSAMLAFEKQNSLTVFSSRFEVVAESTDRRGPFGSVETRQAVIVPANVEYRLDLSGMDREDFVWNERTEQLDVVLPTLRISRPNLDEAQQRVFTDGIYVTRDASADLARNNSEQAERKAIAYAKNPEVLGLARQAAKDAVRQNLAIPLQVAGYSDVNVNVRFGGEDTP